MAVVILLPHQRNHLVHQVVLILHMSCDPPPRRHVAVVPALHIDRIDAEKLQIAGLDLPPYRADHVPVFKLVEAPARRRKHQYRQAAMTEDEQLHLPTQAAGIPLVILAMHRRAGSSSDWRTAGFPVTVTAAALRFQTTQKPSLFPIHIGVQWIAAIGFISSRDGSADGEVYKRFWNQSSKPTRTWRTKPCPTPACISTVSSPASIFPRHATSSSICRRATMKSRIAPTPFSTCTTGRTSSTRAHRLSPAVPGRSANTPTTPSKPAKSNRSSSSASTTPASTALRNTPTTRTRRWAAAKPTATA